MVNHPVPEAPRNLDRYLLQKEINQSPVLNNKPLKISRLCESDGLEHQETTNFTQSIKVKARVVRLLPR